MSENLKLKLKPSDRESLDYIDFDRKKTDNLFDRNNINSGSSLNSSTGELISDALWYVSDYMYVGDKKSILITGLRGSGGSNCFYDENKNYMSTYNAITGFIPVPNGAKYLRINGLLSQLGEGYTVVSQGELLHKNVIEGLNGFVLWENGNKTANFPSQTVTLSNKIGNFDYLRLEYGQVVPDNNLLNCRGYIDFRPFVSGNFEILCGTYDGARYLKTRSLNVVSETQIKFSSAFQEGSNNDRVVVPMRIYGIKRGV